MLANKRPFANKLALQHHTPAEDWTRDTSSMAYAWNYPKILLPLPQELALADFFSKRFSKNVWITRHARDSMQRRGIDDATLERIIEEGEFKRRDELNVWIFKHIDGRADNLICAAVVEETSLMVKTVMINWELEDET